MAQFPKLHSNAAVLAKYMSLTQPDYLVQLMYVWVDSKQTLRAKTKTISFVPNSVSQLPICHFDGISSGCQLDEFDSNVYLLPVRLYKDPFRRGSNKLVLCETVTYDMNPTEWNTRHSCNLIVDLTAEHEPWFGIEQEYLLLDGYEPDRIYGWPAGGFPNRPEPYYCGVGTNRVVGRDILTTHYRACLYAGINMFGINMEAMPGQLEYQIGPSKGISIGDDLWMSRFILHRIAEEHHIVVSLAPKFMEGWQGNGAHTNFSTKAMRNENGGMEQIEVAIKKLAKNHMKHIAKYDPSGGVDNARRLVQGFVTVPIDQFVWGRGKRATSVRVPKPVEIDRCGYLEDRRPAGNMDPYVVCEQLLRTICLDE